MAFMKPQRFGDLDPSDVCYTEDGQRGKDVWMKVDGEGFNAVSDDGRRTITIDDAKIVKVVRKRIHVLDLRPGDQVSMAAYLGIAYMMNTVIKVEDIKDSRHITFVRPMIFGDSFGTTCPSGKVHVEKYTTSVPVNDRKRDDYYHLHGVDTSAVYKSYCLVLSPGGCADRERMATFLQAMGDERSMAEILCLDGLKINSQVIERLMKNYIDVREVPPPYPDRDDGAEKRYQDELRGKDKLSKWEQRYMNIVDANRPGH